MGLNVWRLKFVWYNTLYSELAAHLGAAVINSMLVFDDGIACGLAVRGIPFTEVGG